MMDDSHLQDEFLESCENLTTARLPRRKTYQVYRNFLKSTNSVKSRKHRAKPLFPPSSGATVDNSMPSAPLRDSAFELFDIRAKTKGPYRSSISMPVVTIGSISGQSGATQVGRSSLRPPSPPRIHIPQPPEDEAIKLPEYVGLGDNQEDREILRIVTQGHHVSITIREWFYEMRRNAQAILSFLYLGPSSAARDARFIQTNGITMLLVVRNTLTAQARLLSAGKVANQLGIEHANWDVEGNQQLIHDFPAIFKLINDHLISMFKRHLVMSQNNTNGLPYKKGKVLVFCESGNERSAAVVAAYIMYMYNFPLIKTAQYIQSHRFCVAYDDNLKSLLESYSDIVGARKIVAQNNAAQAFASIGNQPKAKRGRDDLVDDSRDVNMDREDDESRFGCRPNFAPFYDASSMDLRQNEDIV